MSKPLAELSAEALAWRSNRAVLQTFAVDPARQKFVARNIGVSIERFQRLVSGKVRPSQREFGRIDKFLADELDEELVGLGDKKTIFGDVNAE